MPIRFTPSRRADIFGDLFTARQLLALSTFSDLVSEARAKVLIDAKPAGWQHDVIAAGDVSRTFLPGADFDGILDDEVLRLTGPSIDADVRLGRADSGVPSRLVGVQHDGSYRYYLTNLPRDVSPQRVAQRCRVRWEIALDNRLDKSGFNMHEIFSRTAHTARALVHESIAASVLACLLAHKHRLEEGRPRRSKAPRTKLPSMPRRSRASWRPAPGASLMP